MECNKFNEFGQESQFWLGISSLKLRGGRSGIQRDVKAFSPNYHQLLDN